MLANPPYIDAGDPHLQALQNEPLHALTPGPDGMTDLRHLAREARRHLAPGGSLLLEHGNAQGPSVSEALERAGWADIQTRLDLAGWPRCTGARAP